MLRPPSSMGCVRPCVAHGVAVEWCASTMLMGVTHNQPKSSWSSEARITSRLRLCAMLLSLFYSTTYFPTCASLHSPFLFPFMARAYEPLYVCRMGITASTCKTGMGKERA